jgi:hypothetical protein
MAKKKGKKSSLDIESKRHVFALVGLFLFLGFMLSFVNIPQDVSITGDATRESCDAAKAACVDSANVCNANYDDCIKTVPVSNVFIGFFDSMTKILVGGADTLSEAFLKWTFFGIFTILLFSIFSSASWPQSKSLRWILAIPISFIAISLISNTDLLTSIQGYGALGLTFIIMLPLAVMFFFSSMLLQDKVTIGKILFQLIGWYYYVLFTIYVLYQYLAGQVAGEIGWFWEATFWSNLSDAAGFPVIIIFLSGLVGVVVIMSNRWFRRWIRQLGRELIKEVGEDVATARESTVTGAGSTGSH